MAYRQKINSKNPYRKRAAEPLSPKGDYYQFVDGVANQVKDAINYLRYDSQKALADTIDGLLGTLADFQTCAWVLEQSDNRDAFRQAKNVESLYSSSQEALISMALSAVEQDVKDTLAGKYNIEDFGGKSEQTPMQEMYYRTDKYDYSDLPEADTQPIEISEQNQKTRPYPINEPSTQNLRVPR